MQISFSGPVWYWRGPAPFFFVSLPHAQADDLADVADGVTYGWGMVPVTATIGGTTWTTSLWPKDATYVLPVKAAVRKAESLDLDDVADVVLTVGA